ncbi:MAG TPA: malto-oligosyltrehalose synthase [Kofleriaceae bacterium]
MQQPRATYRLQLHAGFTFADAVAAVPYLAELGISHLYLSPILTAAKGSTHGYDVVDPERINDELGGEQGFARLVEAAHAAGLGILLDIVPNHMSIATGRSQSGPLHIGAGSRNRWWYDVLENGPSSYYAHFFDVDWTVGDDRVLLPVLGERYGRAIQNGVIRIVEVSKGRLAVRAHEHELPVAPRSLGGVVKRAAERCRHAELAFIGDALSALPSLHRREPEARRRRHRDKAVLVGRLAALCEDLAVAVALADEVAAINADPFGLDALLEQQAYRLVHWTVSANQISYRRFFDINTLVGLRSEDEDVFEASHGKVLELVQAGAVDGLRIDHVDGLRDPEAYLQRLRARAPDAWIVVEKILTADETLPASWPIDGTTGYDFLEKLSGLFVDPASERELTEAFELLTGEVWEPTAASRRARLEVMTDALHSEVTRLTELAHRATSASPTCRDYTRTEVETALAEIFAGFPTYRTYLSEQRREEIDRARLASAVTAALDSRPELDRDLLAYLEGVLAFEIPGDAAHELAYSAQQVTGAITAKGDEDTLSYRQVRLLARCDVGAELRQWAHSPSVIHHALAGARPGALLATSTHDTKRSEDVRARIAVLSELPAEWAPAVARWGERAARYWDVAREPVIEYALWQTLVGAWPLPVERAKQYAHKASREARLRTSWRHPDEAFDQALAAWLDRVYADAELVTDVAKLAERIRPHGDRNALAQLLVKLTAPGVPDFYQGTELYDDSLVDPDNRRPVDLGLRRDKLRALADASVRDVAGDVAAMKLWTIRRVLGLRRKYPDRFAGGYRALVASGPHAHRVFAFARGDDLVSIVPRLGVHADGWRDTALDLPPGNWRDVLSDQTFSGGPCAVAQLWRTLPIALLTRA